MRDDELALSSKLDVAKQVMAKAWVTITEGKIIGILSISDTPAKAKKESVEKGLAVAVKREKELGTSIRNKIHRVIMKEANESMLA